MASKEYQKLKEKIKKEYNDFAVSIEKLDKRTIIEKAKEIIEKLGFKVKYSKNLFSNTNGYSSTAKEKAQDINDMFADKDVKMIWCAKGGNNSNSTFEYLDYELIKAIYTQMKELELIE